MEHLGTRTIETERLTLRPFRIGDAQAMFDGWASDYEVARYMRWQPHENVAQTREILAEWIAEYGVKPDLYRWAIACKDGDLPIGSIGVFMENEVDQRAEVGYCVGRAFWGQGYVTEALKAVLRYMLLEVGLNRVEAYHSVRNPGSGAVMRKAGMTYEGCARQKYRTKEGFHDSDEYAILRSDLKEG